MASNVLVDPEGRAALASARRANRLSAGDYGKAVTDFESLQGELVMVGVDGQLARHAGELAEELGLRGYDAVHLASAFALGSETTLVTWDRDLAGAAMSSGFGVAPPA